MSLCCGKMFLKLFYKFHFLWFSRLKLWFIFIYSQNTLYHSFETSINSDVILLEAKYSILKISYILNLCLRLAIEGFKLLVQLIIISMFDNQVCKLALTHLFRNQVVFFFDHFNNITVY